MPLVRISSGDIHYTAHGEGHPLIALHAGLGTGVGDFRKYIPLMSDRYRFILPDRIGYGRSTHVGSFSEPFFPKQVDDLVEFMDALKIEKAAFWGWSDGTVIALNLPISRPDLVSVIVAEAGHYCPVKETNAMFKRLLRPGELTEREIKSFSRQHGDPYWRTLLRVWAERWLEFNRTTDDFYNDRLDEARCPVMFLIGDEDEHVRVWEFEKMHERVESSELIVFKRVGHATHLDPNEKTFSRSVVTFLEKHLGLE
ncbi:MAG: alpha/beta hydrolase [Thermoplasmata archaeon]|nr:alpha/beta hydrolase [Thermoplasmata archaeon]